MKGIAFFLFILSFFCAFELLAYEEEKFYPYKIKKGDSLWKIAPKEHWEIIKKVNRIDEKHLITGRTILLPLETDSLTDFSPVPKIIISDKEAERSINVFLDAQYFGAYEYGNLVFWGPVSSGKTGHQTPIGTYKALWKAKKYRSKKYDSDMPYSVNFSHIGYFIHEQALPGKAASKGCVRTLKEDAEKIFSWIQIGDKISIQ